MKKLLGTVKETIPGTPFTPSTAEDLEGPIGKTEPKASVLHVMIARIYQPFIMCQMWV